MTNPATPGPAAPTPPSGGMPKWLIILLIVLLVIVLGCCGGFTACFLFARSAARNAPNAVQSFVENRTGVTVDTSGTGLALPADFPKDVPVASGYKVTSKITPPGAKGGMIMLTGSSSIKSLADFYTTEMAKQGWKQAGETADADSFTQTYSKDKQAATIVGTDGGKNLTINYGSN